MKEMGQIQRELRKSEIHQRMSALSGVLNKGHHVNFVRDTFHILTLYSTIYFRNASIGKESIQNYYLFGTFCLFCLCRRWNKEVSLQG